MKTELFDYSLPEELIAVRPPESRDGGRMFVVGAEGFEHALVSDFVSRLEPGDLLVLNRTRVRRARLFCKRPTGIHGEGGGRVELLFLHPTGRDGECAIWAALGRAGKALRIGDVIEFPGLELSVVGKDEEGTLRVRVGGDLEAALDAAGQMPIPPYFKREADESDVERYQTVFAQDLGSAAAPTAGLHLTPAALDAARARGVRIQTLLLHVGIGTFRPVSTEDLDEHPMHEEEYEIGPELAEEIRCAKSEGRRVVAVGTTVVRALESAALADADGASVARRARTRLLIQPGYEFRVVDALLTNFHQPKSTLLSLVSAFAGRERVLGAYAEAVQMRYRFLSYGDAMWIPGRLR